MTTAHDAEEALRPYLGEVYETGSLPVDAPQALLRYNDALQAALGKALELLGV